MLWYKIVITTVVEHIATQLYSTTMEFTLNSQIEEKTTQQETIAERQTLLHTILLLGELTTILEDEH